MKRMNLPAVSNGESASQASSVLRSKQLRIRPPFWIKNIDQVHTVEMPSMAEQPNKRTSGMTKYIQ